MKLVNSWPKMGYVDVVSGPEASTQLNITYRANEIVAILEVMPNIPLYVGFKSQEDMVFLSNKITPANGQFGMKLGDGAVGFFVFAADMQTSLELHLVGYASTTDPHYNDLVVY